MKGFHAKHKRDFRRVMGELRIAKIKCLSNSSKMAAMTLREKHLSATVPVHCVE
jgi:hypothetical protein